MGQYLLRAEQSLLTTLLKQHYGKHALLIGMPCQASLLQATHIPCHALINPLSHTLKASTTTPLRWERVIDSDLHELPIQTGSVDLVLLAHTQEFIENPHQLLMEACRVVKPEGLIAIIGFNPFSLWNLRKFSEMGRFISAYKIKYWLKLADFELEQKKTILFRPPIRQESLYQKLACLEKIACLPGLGGVYILLARAKVVPLTPIRMQWKQPLTSMTISTSMTGHVAHHSK